ncbi:cyclic nucleotide-binding domain-containing protein [Patescibacteria group bacterium]
MNETNPIMEILKTIPLFENLNEESAQLISSNITLEYFPENHVIFNQGDPGIAMYIIKHGQIRIYQGNSDDIDSQVELANLTDNSFFGEMALISEKERNANAVAVIESEVFVLKKDDFYKLVNENPDLTEQIGKEFINRIKENMRNDNFN